MQQEYEAAALLRDRPGGHIPIFTTALFCPLQLIQSNHELRDIPSLIIFSLAELAGMLFERAYVCNRLTQWEEARESVGAIKDSSNATSHLRAQIVPLSHLNPLIYLSSSLYPSLLSSLWFCFVWLLSLRLLFLVAHSCTARETTVGRCLCTSSSTRRCVLCCCDVM